MKLFPEEEEEEEKELEERIRMHICTKYNSSNTYTRFGSIYAPPYLGETRQARDHGPTCIPHAQPCGVHTPNTWPIGHVRRNPTKPRSHPTSAHFRTAGGPVNSKGNWLINNNGHKLCFLKIKWNFLFPALPCPARPGPARPPPPLSPPKQKKEKH